MHCRTLAWLDVSKWEGPQFWPIYQGVNGCSDAYGNIDRCRALVGVLSDLATSSIVVVVVIHLSAGRLRNVADQKSPAGWAEERVQGLFRIA